MENALPGPHQWLATFSYFELPRSAFYQQLMLLNGERASKADLAGCSAEVKGRWVLMQQWILYPVLYHHNQLLDQGLLATSLILTSLQAHVELLLVLNPSHSISPDSQCIVLREVDISPRLDAISFGLRTSNPKLCIVPLGDDSLCWVTCSTCTTFQRTSTFAVKAAVHEATSLEKQLCIGTRGPMLYDSLRH